MITPSHRLVDLVLRSFSISILADPRSDLDRSLSATPQGEMIYTPSCAASQAADDIPSDHSVNSLSLVVWFDHPPPLTDRSIPSFGSFLSSILALVTRCLHINASDHSAEVPGNLISAVAILLLSPSWLDFWAVPESLSKQCCTTAAANPAMSHD